MIVNKIDEKVHLFKDKEHKGVDYCIVDIFILHILQ